MAVVDISPISKVQPMREGEINAVDVINLILAAFPLETSDIADLAITTAKLAADAVTNDKLADDAVNTENIVDGAVNTADLADSAVTNAKVADDAISTAKVQDLAITTAKLAADAVTNDKLADDAISTAKVQDLAITTAKLAADIKNQLDFLQTVPSMEFGTSNTITVAGSSYTEITATFTAAKTEAPIVFCGIQNATGNLACVVTQVTNLQFAARVYNLSTTDVQNVTVDWLAISGR